MFVLFLQNRNEHRYFSNSFEVYRIKHFQVQFTKPTIIVQQIINDYFLKSIVTDLVLLKYLEYVNHASLDMFYSSKLVGHVL